MREGAKVAGHQPEGEALSGDERARDEIARWVAEHEAADGVIGRGAEKLLVVGVAADDAVEDDDVDGFDRGGIDGDVVQSPLDAALDTGLADEPRGLVLVG